MTRLTVILSLLALVSLIAMYGGGATGHSVREVYIPCGSSCNNGLCDYKSGTCVCYPFYTGEHCDRPRIRPCADYYCFNEGTCQVNGSGREYCQCPEGYTGEYCLTNDAFCLNNSSCATCVNFTTSNCSDSFPNQCEMETQGIREECGSCYCFNGGTCQNGTCICSEGFGGNFCQYGCAASNEALQPCGSHYCYYGGICMNNTCHCPSNTSGVYCEYVHAPSGQLRLEVTGLTASAILSWHNPVGYEGIASSGGVRYMASVQNLATGRTDNVQASETSITQTLTHSTEYCFRVRAEVSGGVGEYSESKCYTTPGFLPVVTIATPVAAAFMIILLTVMILCAICCIWRMKCHRAKGKVDAVELTQLEATEIDHDNWQVEARTGTDASEYDTVVEAINEYVTPGTENVYQDINEAIDEINQSKVMNGEETASASVKARMNGDVTANPLKEMNKDSDTEKGNVPGPTSNIDAGGDPYEDMAGYDPMNGDPLSKADVTSIISDTYI